MTTHIDPVAFVEEGLAPLPADPAQTTSEQLQRLTAIAGQLAEHMTAIRTAMAQLSIRADDADEGELVKIAAERHTLGVANERAQEADETFNAYAIAAFKAHGFDIDPDSSEAASA